MEVSQKFKGAIAAKLHDAGGELTARWFVYYSILDPLTGKFKRIKVYEGFAQCKSLEDKRKNAKKLITRINRQLKDGKDPASDNYISLPVEPVHTTTNRRSNPKTKDVVIELPVPTIEQVLNDHLKENCGHLRRKTTQTYQSQLRTLYKWLKKNNLASSGIATFTAEHARTFINYLSNELKRHNTTRNNYTTNLKSIFASLKLKGIINVNPFDNIGHVRSSKTSKKPFNKHQRETLKKIFFTRDKELWLFVQIMYYCFIRPKELRLLEIRDIDLFEGKICVRGEIAKNRVTMDVRIPKQLLQILIKRKLNLYPQNYYVFGKEGKPGAKPCSTNYFSGRHLKILRELGYTKDYALYSWKHTGVISAVKGGIHIKDLQSQLRHQSLDEVQEYLKDLGVMDSDDLRDKFPDF